MATVSQGERGIRFSFDIDPPIKDFGYEVGRYAKGIADWTGLLKTFSPLFQRHMAEEFETEGAATGSRWAAVSPEYAERKRATGHGSKIGVYSGALRSSMAGGAGYSVKVTQREGSFGMSTSSAAVPYGRKFAEKRPVVRISRRQLREYLDLTKQWTVSEARKAGIGNASLGEGIRLGGGVGTASVLSRSS
jgi:hypothetical protein